MDDDAERHFKHAISLNANNQIACFYYALFLNDRGRDEEAEIQWNKIACKNPVLLAAYANFLSKSATEGKELGKYYHLKRKSLKESSSYEYTQSFFISANEKRNLSKIKYEETLKIDPNNAVIRYSYALFLSQQYEMHYEAMREVEKAMNIEPSNPYVLFAYGYIAANEQKYKEAIAKYKKGLKNPIALHPVAKSAIYNNLGWTYTKLADTSFFLKLFYYFQAYRYLNKSIKEDMHNIKALRNRQAFSIKRILFSKAKKVGIALLVVATITSAFLLYLGNIDFTVDIYGKLMLDGKSLLVTFSIATLILLYHYLDNIKGVNVAGVKVDLDLEKNNPLSNERLENIDSRPCEILSPRFLFLGYI